MRAMSNDARAAPWLIALLSLLVLGGCQAKAPSLPDAGIPLEVPAGQWTWVPVEGSQCALGSTAGFGINLSTTSDSLLIFLQGGGACWNAGTCAPSPAQFGPICGYGTVCLYDNAGGTQPTASHVAEADPFPLDGGGAFPGELAQLQNVRALDRADPTNPFRDATFVYVPYCTGDLHAGQATRTYPFQASLGGPSTQVDIHFSGATNMALFLQTLHAVLPGTRRIWLTGSSAGGYGATFNLERTRREFSSAQVHLLADSSPFLDTPRWEAWRQAWNPALPEDCPACDAGLPEVMAHLVSTYPDTRFGLLARDQDAVIAWYLFGTMSLNDLLSPPVGPYGSALASLEAQADGTANAKYFVVSGTSHVLWPGYGTRLPDGGYSPPVPSNDGGTDLKAWIDAWATGAPGWESTR
jgi:hypothetical protein